jgi:ABC-type phosphate transport system permease subunit
LLRTLAIGVLVVIAGIAITVFSKAWPSFSHNGLAWFGSGGDVDAQFNAMINGPRDPANYVYHFRAWPLIWATILTSGLAVIFRLGSSERSTRRSGSWRGCRRLSTG